METAETSGSVSAMGYRLELPSDISDRMTANISGCDAALK